MSERSGLSELPDLSFLEAGAVSAARALIGWRLYRQPVESSNSLVGGTIVETEAYTQDDAASHSYRGETPRTKVMFGPAGQLYVYFTYGLHHCLNIVTGPVGSGEAVLIRALIPDKGLATMRQRRQRPDTELTNGPAKLCQALEVTLQDSGTKLNAGQFWLLPPAAKQPTISVTKRIGITKDIDRPWRFVAAKTN